MPTATVETTKPASASEPHGETPIVVDIGTQRPKRIKQLRQGRGKLMDEINLLLNELRADGAISSSAQPVIVVVRERTPARSLLWPLAG